MAKLKFPKITFKRPTVGSIIYWVVGIGLAVGVMIFARSFVACWQITDLPGEMPETCREYQPGDIIFNPQGTPIATMPAFTQVVSAPEEKAPEWDGGSRVNVLFIGVDYRDWEAGEGAPRSDTMILFTIDPITKTAGMLSIPRDMWVNIPGSGYGRINTAYSIGAGAKLPGGGPGLAMQTVEQFLGVPVDYYAQVEFFTFVEMVDTIGGIDVLVRERLVLDMIGGGKDKVVVTPGLRHLNGDRALAYARTRKTEGGDVDRAQRQQDVIFAILDKVFTPEYFPTFLQQAPGLYSKMAAGIHTNLSFEDGLKLANLLKDVKRENIKTGVINYDMVTLGQTVTGGQSASVFKARPDQIRVLRDEIFAGGAVGPMAWNRDPQTLLPLAQQEKARIRVVNGVFAGDYGQRTGVYLQSLGLNVTEVGATGATDQTVIVLFNPKLYTMRFLFSLFGMKPGSGTLQVKFEPNPASTVDMEIRLGTDAYNTNIIP